MIMIMIKKNLRSYIATECERVDKVCSSKSLDQTSIGNLPRLLSLPGEPKERAIWKFFCRCCINLSFKYLTRLLKFFPLICLVDIPPTRTLSLSILWVTERLTMIKHSWDLNMKMTVVRMGGHFADECQDVKSCGGREQGRRGRERRVQC